MDDGILAWLDDDFLDDDLLNHPILLNLRQKKQLGPMEGHDYRATHTRYHHTRMAVTVVRKMYRHLAELGQEPGEFLTLLAATALHDIGHPPFSHPVEKILEAYTGMDHKQRGVLLFKSDIREPDGKKRTLKGILEGRGVGTKNLEAMLEGKHPAMALCSHPLIGGEKVAYLWLDAIKLNDGERPPRPDGLIKPLRYIDDTLCFDISRRYTDRENPLHNLVALLGFRDHMYHDHYFSCSTSIWDRHVQKAVDLAIRSGRFKEKGDRDLIEGARRVWGFMDDELIGYIMNGDAAQGCNAQILREAREALRGFLKPSSAYKPVAALKFPKYHDLEFEGERGYRADPGFISGFLKLFSHDPRLKTDLEKDLQKRFEVPFILTFPRDPKKFDYRQERDFPVRYKSGGEVKTKTFEEMCPPVFTELSENLQQNFAIRLSVPPDAHAQMSSRVKAVRDYFMAKAREYMQSDAA